MTYKTGLNVLSRQMTGKVQECVTAVIAAINGTEGFIFTLPDSFTAEEIVEFFEKIPTLPTDPDYFTEYESGFIISGTVGALGLTEEDTAIATGKNYSIEA